jgi:predicted deacylase
MNTFTFNVNACSKARSFIEAGELRDGSPVRTEIGVIRGQDSGPTLLLTGDYHSDEIAGFETVARIYKNIDPTKLKGTIIMIPVINVPAFIFRSRFYPLEWTSGDVARLENPEISLSGRIGQQLVEQVVEKIDYAMELHGSRDGVNNYPVTDLQGIESEHARKFAESTGTELLSFGIYDGKNNWLKAFVSRGIPKIMVAAGDGGTIDYPYIEILERSVNNVLKYLGMIEGLPILPETRGIVTNVHEIYSRSSGMIRLKVRPGDFVSKGDLVAEVTDIFNELKEKYISPVTGIIARITRFVPCGISDRICKIYETDIPDWKSRTIPELEKSICDRKTIYDGLHP